MQDLAANPEEMWPLGIHRRTRNVISCEVY